LLEKAGGARLSRGVEHGIYCAEMGMQQQDYWLFAHEN
jgi:hypothetical protein